MTESWVDIAGWNGRYQVSDAGRIRSFAGNARDRENNGRGRWSRQKAEKNK